MAERDAAITEAGLAEAVERAVTYRIGLARLAGEPGRLDEAIQGQTVRLARAVASRDGDGWVEAGVVWDTIAAWWRPGLAVRWHPASGRVRIERPVRPDMTPPAVVWHSPYAVGHGRYEALPGYRHKRDGTVACGRCAASAATDSGTADGWESRPLEPGEAYACGLCGAWVRD